MHRLATAGATLVVALATLIAGPAVAASPEQAAIEEAMGAWDILKNNVSFSRLRSKAQGADTVTTGRAKAFGQSVTLEAVSAGALLHRVSLKFGKRKTLKPANFSALFGTDISGAVPADVGNGKLYVDRIEVDFARKRLSALRVVIKAGSWKPFGNSMKISNLEASFALEDPLGTRTIEVRLLGVTKLPAKLASFLGIPRNTLTIEGVIDTQIKSLRLTVGLTTKDIPLGGIKSVVLKGAELRLILDTLGPRLSVGGTLAVRPDKGGPLTLKGDVSVNVTGKIYAQGWNDGAWSNPLGVSPVIHILSPGLGFGIDFAAVPWPMPIIAVQGGLAVGKDKSRPDFRGRALVGIHGGNPTQNMLDAELDSLSLTQLVTPFVRGGVPAGMKSVFDDIKLSDARLTAVPPGPGVELFGARYEPGLLVRGTLKVGNHGGEIYADVSPLGVEAYAAIKPIAFPGFSLTGAAGQPGPSLYFLAKQGLYAAALNGTLNVLGIAQSTDVYFSKPGFNITLSGKLFGIAQASLEVSGPNPLKGGNTLWARGSMAVDFQKALIKEAEAQIEADIKKTKSDFHATKAELKQTKAKLAALDRQIDAGVAKLRGTAARACNALKSKAQTKRDRTRKRDDLNTKIRAADSAIKAQERLIGAAWTKGVFKKSTLNPLDCGSNSAWEVGKCYKCPNGFKRNNAVAVTKHGGCVKDTLGYEREKARQVALRIGYVADRDVAQRLLTGLGAVANAATSPSCKAIKDPNLFKRMEPVASFIRDATRLSNLADGAGLVVDGSEFVAVSTLQTGKWLAKRGGEVAGILSVEKAYFEGCLSTMTDGSVSMGIKGKFAGKPFAGSFTVSIKNPVEAFKALGKTLLKKGKPAAYTGNGICKKQTVPRPSVGSTPITGRLGKMKKGRKGANGRKKATPPPRPGWAQDSRKSEGRHATRLAARPNRPRQPTKPEPKPAKPVSDAEERCRRSVQGKLAWGTNGEMRWPEGALATLCAGTRAADQPAKCFQLVVAGKVKNVPGGRKLTAKHAVEICAGTSNAAETVACLGRELGADPTGRTTRKCAASRR